MAAGAFFFGDFRFDPVDRSLTRGGERVDLSGRYLDALALLLRERGRLVTKDRFLDEVWHGAPVSDEALTQCIRTLRRQLGDDAARPRFIETVPKHGYRFTAAAEWAAEEPAAEVPAAEEPAAAAGAAAETDAAESGAAPAAARPAEWQGVRRAGIFGALGGAVAGIGGGLLYGLAASPAAPGEAIGGISALLVLLAISVSIGFAAGLGVGAGIGAAGLIPGDGGPWSIAGGLVGGLAIGGITKLLGLDAFALLFGRSQIGMTGAAEGALLGAALGLAAWIAAKRQLSLGPSAAVGALAGGAAGLLVPLLGGHLLGGSLDLLVQRFPDARFRLDSIGALLGENGFGPVSEVATAAIEGALFGLCLAAALALARKPAAGGPALNR